MRPDTLAIIHCYKPYSQLNENEHAAVEQAKRVFPHLTFIAPHNMDMSGYGPSVIRLPDQFFTYAGYSVLCKSPQFYQLFLDLGFKYLLITQYDVWIFEDRVDYFLDLFDREGYDYIGAPWYGVHFCRDGVVGNGGYCIRRLEKFRDICAKYGNQGGNEDVVFLRHRGEIKIAPEKLALEWSFEEKPAYAYGLTGGVLPTGTHAYASTPDRIGFWRHFIPDIKEIKAKVGNPFTYSNPKHKIGEND